MKYTKKFNTYSAYQTYTASNNFIQPNVSLCIDTDETYCTSPTGTTYKITDLYHGHEYIEIGGLKWATKNIGANNITDTGLFFHWADTQGYTTQQCINGIMTSYYKYYNYNEDTGNDGITEEYMSNYLNGEIGREYGNMLSSDDAAKAIMHGNWRIPTPEEWQSLITNTDISFTANYNNTNIPGYILTDKLDNTKVLFIPAIDSYPSGSSFPYPIADNSYGTNYWTNAWIDTHGYAQSFFYDGEDATTDDGYNPIEIQYGLPIRAVAN